LTQGHSEFYSVGVDQNSVVGYMHTIDMYDTSNKHDDGLYVKTYSGQVQDDKEFWLVRGQRFPACARRQSFTYMHVFSLQGRW